MEKRVHWLIDQQGRPVANATVRVTQYPGGGVPILYSDDGVTVKANPVSTDPKGRYEYYAANGRYTEVPTTNAGVQPAINDIILDDGLTTNQQFLVPTGTGNAMVVAAFSTGYTLADGDEIRVRSPGRNTTNAPTIQLPGVGTLTIYRFGGQPVQRGDIKASGHEITLRYRAAPARMELVSVGDSWVDVTQFGAKADAGVTDCTAAFQAAHDALGPDGGTIFVPPGDNYYTLSGTVAFTKPVRLMGDDWYSAEIFTQTNGHVVFTSVHKLVVENFNFTALFAAAATCVFIKHLAASANHSGSIIRNCFFNGSLRCYWSERANGFTVEKCRFGGQYGLYLENLTNSDEGDWFVESNTFACVKTDINIVSTAGGHISNNKFNGPNEVHIDMPHTDQNIGNILIGNNSFEGQSIAGIRSIGTTGVNVKMVVSGNQFSSGGATHIVVGKGCQHPVITGNVFSDVNAANGIGVDIQASALGVTIVGNDFHQILTAIKSAGVTTGQHIKDNRFHLASTGSANVTNFYLGGEDDDNPSIAGPGSEKEFEVDRFIANASNAAYVNAYQFLGDCIVEVFVTGVIQGAGVASKYRKVLVAGTTVTDLIALVSTGAAFDLQVVASGGFVVVGVKRNGATGTSVTAQVRVKISGYVRDFSKV